MQETGCSRRNEVHGAIIDTPWRGARTQSDSGPGLLLRVRVWPKFVQGRERKERANLSLSLSLSLCARREDGDRDGSTGGHTSGARIVH